MVIEFSFIFTCTKLSAVNVKCNMVQPLNIILMCTCVFQVFSWKLQYTDALIQAEIQASKVNLSKC